MRFALFVFAVLGCTACLAPAASAWDDVPPPPAPPSLADLPPSGAFPDEDVPEPDGSDNEPASEALDEEAPPTAIEETVPEPYYVPASISAAPAAATQPRLTRATDYPSGKDCRPGCAQRRDDCCWPIDCRGCRYGRFEVTLEGTSGMLVEAATGPFALEDYGSADKITYDGLDYGSFFDEFGGRLTVAYAINPQEWV
jgi:hypothetical protein